MLSMQPRPGILVAGRYELLRPLASGGMGTLWVARHDTLGIDVALKFISGVGDQPELVRRFQREARAAARVRGRNLVHIYDFGFDAGRPFLVMELLEGESLADLIEREAPMSAERVHALLEQLHRGLKLVHVLGIVHRDIKPSNLFVAREGEEWVLKLLDFGIAKWDDRVAGIVSAGSTTTGTLLGSPGYMSPEQARGIPVDERSDLWSVAVVLYELLTGHALFTSEHAGDSIARICAEPIPSPASFVPELGSDFDRFFERSLARDPALRFATIDELAVAFSSARRSAFAGADLAPTLLAPARGRVLATASIPPRAPSNTASGGLALASESAPVRPSRRSRVGALALALVLSATLALVAFVLDPFSAADVDAPDDTAPTVAVQSEPQRPVPPAVASDDRARSDDTASSEPAAALSAAGSSAGRDSSPVSTARLGTHSNGSLSEPKRSRSDVNSRGLIRERLPKTPPKAPVARDRVPKRDPFSGLIIDEKVP